MVAAGARQFRELQLRMNPCWRSCFTISFPEILSSTASIKPSPRTSFTTGKSFNSSRRCLKYAPVVRARSRSLFLFENIEILETGAARQWTTAERVSVLAGLDRGCNLFVENDGSKRDS